MATLEEVKTALDTLSAADRAEAAKYAVTARDGNASHSINNKLKWQVVMYVLGWRDEEKNPVASQNAAKAFVGMYGLTGKAGKYVTDKETGEKVWQPWDKDNLTASQYGIEAIRRVRAYVRDVRKAWKVKQAVDAARKQAIADAEADDNATE